MWTAWTRKIFLLSCQSILKAISFFRYSEIGNMTNILAVMEWVIFLIPYPLVLDDAHPGSANGKAIRPYLTREI